jgi:hypothetical protein
MTRKTMLALLAEADANLPDNATHLITAAAVRSLIKDVVDSFSPGYGIVSNANLTLAALTAVPRVIPYVTTLAQTPEYVVGLGAGTVTRLAQGLPTTVNRISFYADMEAPAGNEVAFAVTRNGVAIPGGVTVSGQGATNFVGVALSIGTTSPDGADYAYAVTAARITGGGTLNLVLANARLIVESVPTLGI